MCLHVGRRERTKVNLEFGEFGKFVSSFNFFHGDILLRGIKISFRGGAEEEEEEHKGRLQIKKNKLISIIIIAINHQNLSFVLSLSLSFLFVLSSDAVFQF